MRGHVTIRKLYYAGAIRARFVALLCRWRAPLSTGNVPNDKMFHDLSEIQICCSWVCDDQKIVLRQRDLITLRGSFGHVKCRIFCCVVAYMYILCVYIGAYWTNMLRCLICRCVLNDQLASAAQCSGDRCRFEIRWLGFEARGLRFCFSWTCWIFIYWFVWCLFQSNFYNSNNFTWARVRVITFVL